METTMSMHSRSRFAARILAAALAIPFVAACDEDPIEPDEHAEVAEMRLTVGSQTVIFTEGGAQSGLTIPNGNATVTATFFDEDGDAIALHDDEFEVRIVPPNTNVVTFTRTGAFTGTLNGVADGTAVVEVGIWHLDENHYDFGDFDLNVTVQ
jgi:hypothetical protein